MAVENHRISHSENFLICRKWKVLVQKIFLHAEKFSACRKIFYILKNFLNGWFHGFQQPTSSFLTFTIHHSSFTVVILHSTLYESGYFIKTKSYISEICSRFLRVLMESFFTNFDPWITILSLFCATNGLFSLKSHLKILNFFEKFIPP